MFSHDVIKRVSNDNLKNIVIHGVVLIVHIINIIKHLYTIYMFSVNFIVDQIC